MDEISETVFQQYTEIQHSGVTNMVMQSQVRQVAVSRGYDELVQVIDNGEYHQILENYGDLEEKYVSE